MKALVCATCGDIRGLQEEWVSCRCGNVEARWVDPRAGTAEFRGQYPSAYMLGLNNHLLGPALQGYCDIFEHFRELHDIATNAPNHVFDKSRAACWAVIVKPGRTSDVKWLVTE